MKGLLAIFILLATTLLPLSCSIRSNSPKNPSNLLASNYTNSSSKVSNHTSLVLPLLHRRHPKVETLLGPVVELEPLSVSPINKTYANKYVFFVEFGVGDFPALAVFDTGSFFTWLQVTPTFDPTLSSTYQVLKCKTNECRAVPGNTCTPDIQCLYKLEYADGKTSEGDVGRDTFHFYAAAGKGHDPKSTIPVPMVFGTGTDGSDEVPGVLGVSTYSLGLLTGLHVAHFSVCFPRYPRTESYLRFGTDSITDYGMSTPMFVESWHTSFRVTSITIGGSKLTSLGGGGVFIFDSGAETTYLHPDAMLGVVLLVKQSLVDAEPETAPAGNYELCYPSKYKSDLLDLEISFELDKWGSLVFDYGHLWVGLGSEICLAFKRSTTYRSIFGVKQMEGWNFGFDYQNHELFFAEDPC